MFPKTASGLDPMTDAPDRMDETHLREARCHINRS
jgi:aspartyl-tRNA synthetase